jgi:hypothetical protein
MKIKDLLLKKEYGFTETFSRNMTTVKDTRGKLVDLEGHELDIADWANKQCLRKCGIEPQQGLDNVTCIDCCHRCDIPMIYLSLVKLLMIEEVAEKVEIEGENIETKED